MADPSGSRSGFITLLARLARSAGVETTVQEVRRQGKMIRSLVGKDMAVNCWSVVCLLYRLDYSIYSEMTRNFF